MLESLTRIIREHTGNESIVINEDMDLRADLGLNSLDLVNLACVVEDEFDIEIPDRSIKDFHSVKDVLLFIEEQS
ncbi:MAG: acyl carrier protein [Oliverpabstia sp.]|nr:acyl carrier protein [Oliverpabstia sp.]